jgi:hypothetical protein
MRPRTILIGLAVLLAVIVLAALAGSGTPPRPGSTQDTTSVPRAPVLTKREIDRQDRASPAVKQRESRIFDSRPLLNMLPAQSHGVDFDIGGLSADRRRTVITADAHGAGRTRAVAAYRALRRRVGDDSRNYELRITP